MLLFLGPAMGRQTTPIILTAILIVMFIKRHKMQVILLLKILPVLGILTASFYIMTLSPQTSQGSLLSVFPNYGEIFKFMAERFFYYGTILTSGITGIFMLLFLGGGVLQHLAKIVKDKYQYEKADLIWPLTTLLLTILFIRLQPHTIYWLLFCCLYLFIFDYELRLPIAWAGASLLSFLAVRYYHNGYLLEAGFPLAMALGILMNRMINSATLILRKCTNVRFNRIVTIVGSGVLLLFPLIFFWGSKVPFISERVDVIQIAIESNRNFGRLMHYMQHELPKGAIIYEMAEEELGTTRFDRRFLPLRERAERIKIMSIEDKLIMLKVLGRYDIKIFPASKLSEAHVHKDIYLIALNNFEREIAESNFNLKVVKEFVGSDDSAAIYCFIHGPEEASSL